MPPKTNAKGRVFAWSHSALNNYETCPSKYAAASFYYTTPYVESEPAKWGNRVHKSAEQRIKCIPHDDPEAFKPVEPYVTAMLRSGHRPEAELEVVLTRDFTPTTWWSKTAWLRVKIDVVIPKGVIGAKDRGREKAVALYDWKTGKVNDKPDQLMLNIAALSAVRPWYEDFTAKYIWTAHELVTGIAPVCKADVPGIWADFLPRVARMEDAWEHERFPARPSGLCPWCQVDNCGKRRGVRKCL